MKNLEQARTDQEGNQREQMPQELRADMTSEEILNLAGKMVAEQTGDGGNEKAAEVLNKNPEWLKNNERMLETKNELQERTAAIDAQAGAKRVGEKENVLARYGGKMAKVIMLLTALAGSSEAYAWGGKSFEPFNAETGGVPIGVKAGSVEAARKVEADALARQKAKKDVSGNAVKRNHGEYFGTVGEKPADQYRSF